ncbi:MAG: hypothetical protein KJZ54_04535 [Phycisphaerales bacterium]|nr:hypothetical protein [Phycisphaerales bacterium]
MSRWGLPPPEPECVSDAMAEVLRRKTPAERLAVLDGMWRSARDMIEHVLREQHPEWDDDRIRREVARRLSHGAV